MKKQVVVIISTLAVISLVCLAVYISASRQGASNWSGKSNTPVVCRLAYTAKGYYAPQILASQKGWFATGGVKVVDVKLGMSTGIAAAEALVSGAADVAAMGDVPALIALASPRECVLVAACGGGEMMHSIIVTGKSGITNPADLAGKRIGVHFGSSTHGAVYLFFEHHGIDPKGVTLMNIPQKDLIEAMMSGSIEAFAASEPTPMISLRKIPEARELACLSGLGNDYPTVIVASRAFADTHPEAVRAVVAGTQKAVEWINSDPDNAAKAIALVTGVPAEVEAAMFRRMDWRVRLDENVISSLAKTADFLFRQGKLKIVPDISELSRPEFLKHE